MLKMALIEHLIRSRISLIKMRNKNKMGNEMSVAPVKFQLSIQNPYQSTTNKLQENFSGMAIWMDNCYLDRILRIALMPLLIELSLLFISQKIMEMGRGL